MNDIHDIEWTDEKIRRLWDYYSKTPPYSKSYFSDVYGGRILRFADLPFSSPLDVLDFGCGAGFLYNHIARLAPNWRYSGLDFSKESVSNLNSRACNSKNFSGAFHVTSIPTELPASSFDIVFLVEVVEHLNDEHLRLTLEEASRLLKPSGLLIITTPNKEDLNKSLRFCPDCGAKYHEWQHIRSVDFDFLSNTLKNTGLSPFKRLEFNVSRNYFVWRIREFVRRIIGRNRDEPNLFASFRKL